MNENKLKRKLDFQKDVITRQLNQIDLLNSKIEKLELQIKEKDEIINSVNPLREELTKNVNELREYKKEYKELIDELKNMKAIINEDAYKGRWNLVKFLIK